MLIAAAALLVAIGIAHSYLGERYILVRLFRRDNLPRLFGGDWFTKRTLRFAWHLTTVAWLGIAGVLLALDDPGGSGRALALQAVSVTFGVCAVVAAAASRFRHLSWTVFLAVAVLTWLAAR